MDGLGAGFLAGGDDLLGDEIAFGRRRRPDMHGLVGHLDMKRIAIGVGIDGNRGNPHATGRLDHPAGDLATIGYQYFLEHRRPKSFPSISHKSEGCSTSGNPEVTLISAISHARARAR